MCPFTVVTTMAPKGNKYGDGGEALGGGVSAVESFPARHFLKLPGQSALKYKPMEFRMSFLLLVTVDHI